MNSSGQEQSNQRYAVPAESLKELSNDSLEIRLNDPWVRKLPLEVLIPIQLEAISNSKATVPFKLLVAGRNILEFIQEARSDCKIMEMGPQVDPRLVTYNNSNAAVAEFKVYRQNQRMHQNMAAVQLPTIFGIFEGLFKRITCTKFDPEDVPNLRKFYDYVWSCHMDDKIDFSESRVIQILLEKHPEYLEASVVESMKNSNPGRLVSLCKKSSHTFQILFKLQCQMYYYFNRHSRILDFTQEFLKQVEEAFVGDHLNTRFAKDYNSYISLHPDAFHPLLWFINQIKLQPNLHGKLSLENPIVRDELLKGIDDLIGGQKSKDDFDLRVFFLASNPITMQVINSAHDMGVITLNRFPSVWSLLHKS